MLHDKEWKNDFQNMLLRASGYSGNKEPGKKRISASSLTSNMLELYLDYKHGKSNDVQFEASNLGSIYQLGVDLACDENSKQALEDGLEPQYISGQRFEFELPNGWILTGEADQIDMINKVIIDNKVSTTSSLKKIKEEGKAHQYAIQLGVYKLLAHKFYGDHFDGALAFVDKNSSYFKPQTGPIMNYIDIETYDYETIIKMAVDKSNELQKYIDLGLEPPICENRFPYKSKGVTTPMKCHYYCNYSQHCKHFNSNSKTKANLMNLEVTDRSSSKPYSAADIDTSKINF